MRDKILIRLANVSEKHPYIVFIFSLMVTAVAFVFMLRLELSMHFKNLMPQDHPMVKEFNQIVDEYKTASMIIIAATGNEQELKAFADSVAPEIEAMKEYVQRVDYKLERDFFLKHGFMLQKVKDLKNSKAIFSDLNLFPLLVHLNDSFEETYVYDEESISTKEKENSAILFLDGIQYWINTIQRYLDAGVDDLDKTTAEKAVDRFLIGDEYFISQDKDMLLIFAQPTFTMTEMDKVIPAENAIDSLIIQTAKKFPSIFAGTTGTIALARDETLAAQEDMYLTSFIALILILILFIFSFRMWVAPLLSAISLMIGIIWTGGFAAITLGSLNIMTSMFSVILIGLGIDFSIHIISVYTENRAAGNDIGDSLKNTFLKSGKGIITGAMTTACAFFTLLVSRSVGMSEFGIVAGSGVIFCMLATLITLPAMLSLRDKLLMKFYHKNYQVNTTEFRFLAGLAIFFTRKNIIILVLCTLLTVFLLYKSVQISFDYNYLNMEPVGLTSIKLQDRMIDEFDATPDFALIRSSSIEGARRIAEEAKDLKIVGMVTSISDYIPAQQEQEQRIPYIQAIRENLVKNQKLVVINKNNFDQILQQFQRLKNNIIEFAQLAYLGGQDKVDAKCKEIIGDIEVDNQETIVDMLLNRLVKNKAECMKGLNLFQQQYQPYMKKLATNMTSTERITLNNLPRNIYNQFSNEKGDQFLVTIYPKEQVWNLSFLKLFTDQMQRLDPRVTGTPPVFYILIQYIAEDGKVAAVLTLIVIFLLLLIDFKKLKYVLLAMVPLIIGVIWMVGTMSILGLQLTMLNVMGIPLILGIGIDDGVHILHRYRIEGIAKIKTVFSSTGKAVLLTSLTTMLAFGSFKFATYRGLGSLGIALFIGVGTCFLSSIVVLPALLGWLEKGK
jgi:hopanoid biosynthesis associated RND transporter like protein HpnN